MAPLMLQTEFDTPNVMTVFISWINLDLGIETCLYDGMDSYGKSLLQLVFPVYLIFLVGIIIVLCEFSQRLSTLLGKRNPVAALCTLILLSHSKLLRTTIAALQYTYLDYPDGSSEIVWLYDANVLYFNVSHIPRFIAASVIIMLGAVYTTLLLFGQTFYHCSHHKTMKWISHPKYDSFIKAYHAPLTPRHRYWVGLLLLARIVHYLISAFSSDPIIILSAGVIASGLVLFKLLNKNIYTNWLLDTLETSFLFNLVILSSATLYIKVVDGDELALVYTSVAVSFITFIIIVIYHCFEQCWGKVRMLHGKVQDALNRHRMYQPVPSEDSDPEDLSDDDDQYIDAELAQYTADQRDTPPHYYTQPIIHRAVRDDQLREPALDVLIPVQPEDYKIPPKPRPQHSEVTTYTEVNIRDTDSQ